MNKKRCKTRLMPSIAILCSALFSCKALAEKPVPNDPMTDWFDSIWSNATIYGEKGDYSQPFIKLRGRFHGTAFSVDGDGDNETDWENRRIRLGADFNFSEKLEFSFDFNMWREDGDNIVENFDYISFTYAISDDTELSFGKLRRNPLTREDSTSSNDILTIERSLLASRSFLDNVGGVYLEHKSGDWTYGGGVLKGSTEEDLSLPSLDGSTLFQGNIAKQINDMTELRLDYLFNSGDEDNNDVAPFRHVVSLNSETRSGPWGLITDLIYASALPEARGDLYGLVIMPHYMLTERLQLVGRYTWSGSDEENGIRLLNRYERRAVPEGFEFGDNHQAFYAGLNYYFYGHKFKLMSGIEYTDFDSVSGNTSVWTGSAALRFYF
uniref:porin n=1 Tax=Ningiella ruwaisensis TaxID=2364274 RepID=UPI0010A04327|nr:porin [Ningiella ruwaisensis]